MAFASGQSKNCGGLGPIDSFGANGIETSGTGNFGTLKQGGVTIEFGTPATWTQTYTTASRTVPNPTYSDPAALTYSAPAADGSSDLVTTASTQSTPWGFASQAQADAIATKTNLLRAHATALRTALIALAADVTAIRTALIASGADGLVGFKNVTALVDDLQRIGADL